MCKFFVVDRSCLLISRFYSCFCTWPEFCILVSPQDIYTLYFALSRSTAVGSTRSYHYRHYADIWKHWAYKMFVGYIVLSVFKNVFFLANIIREIYLVIIVYDIHGVLDFQLTLSMFWWLLDYLYVHRHVIINSTEISIICIVLGFVMKQWYALYVLLCPCVFFFALNILLMLRGYVVSIWTAIYWHPAVLQHTWYRDPSQPLHLLSF